MYGCLKGASCLDMGLTSPTRAASEASVLGWLYSTASQTCQACRQEGEAAPCLAERDDRGCFQTSMSARQAA